MDILFSTRKLEKLCNSSKTAIKKHGDQCAKKLRSRLDELSDAESLEDMRHLPQARCHPLSGDRAGEFAVDLKHPKRLIFTPDHDPLPELPDGGLDWKQVTSITILDIIDYHG